MRHRKAGVKLNRTSSHKSAMFRNMVTSLLKYDRIQTTDAKAKELRRWADKVITLAKRGDLHARRRALSIVREKDVVHKLFEEAEKRFGKISGGYTRVIKIGRRPGDAAPISLVELVAAEPADKKKKSGKKTKPAKSKTIETKAAAAPEVGESAEPAEAAAEAPAETKAEEGEVKPEEVAVAEEPVEAAAEADASADAGGAEEAGEAPEKKEEK